MKQRSVRRFSKLAFSARVAALLVSVGLALTLSSPAWSRLSDRFNHPELKWRELATEHFTIIFHPEVQESAQDVAEIVEEVYEPVCKALGAYPKERTTVVVTDYNDFSREFMRRLEHVMFVEAPTLNPAMLGRREWLRHIVRHEFTHAVQYAATGARYGPVGEWVGMAALPEWFVEGTAEWQATSGSLYETGFARRAALSHQLAPLARIDRRARQVDLIDLWLVYAQGHDMVVYLVRNFGEDAVKRILDYYRRCPDFDLALKHVTGMDQKTFYNRFVESLTQQSQALAQQETENIEDYSERLNVNLRGALAAAWSPDGKKVAVFGIYDWEDPQPILYIADADGSNMKEISDQVGLYSSAQFSWSPDGTKLVYSSNRPGRYGSLRAKIVVVNADGSGEKIISGDLRAIQPSWSPAGDRIACIAYLNESTRLVTMTPEGQDVRVISPAGAYQCFSPTWSPDGTKIAFSTASGGALDIAVINADGSGYRKLTDDPAVDQYPQWSPRGDRIAFCYYRKGFSNVFTVSPEGGPLTQVTDVRTAALLYPTWTPGGDRITVSLFKTREANLVTFDADRQASVRTAVEEASTEPAAVEQPQERSAAPKIDMTAARKYNSWGHFRHFLTRPLVAEDGRGRTVGLRSWFGDPLRKHLMYLDTGVGLASNRGTVELQYTNAQTEADIGMRYRQRVNAPVLYGGQTLYQRERRSEIFATLPKPVRNNLFTRQNFRFSLNDTDLSPSYMPVPIVPAPPRYRVRAVDFAWDRNSVHPNEGGNIFRVGISRADDRWGSDVTRTVGVLTYDRFWWAPTKRQRFDAHIVGEWFDGESLPGTSFQRTIALGWVKYTHRLSDDLYSKQWPYLDMARLEGSVSYEFASLLSGQSGGIPMDDFVKFELRNTGSVTRWGQYTLTGTVAVNTRTGHTSGELDLLFEGIDLGY